MGNTSSGVSSGGKNQVEASQSLYKLADLGGGGSLVPLVKEALSSGSFDALDATIRAELPPFLYRNGEGAMLPINDVIAVRHRERTGQPFTRPKKPERPPLRRWFAGLGWARLRLPGAAARGRGGEADAGAKEAEAEGRRKEVCWLLTERGGVGETLLHVCLLCGSELHMVLARRLLLVFPKLVNDVYVGNEYYGENSLHMAIVNEDVAFVKFLIGVGVDLHQRASGAFFTADDQKASMRDVWDDENVGLALKTKYGGHMYWGEYPLSFAACLQQDFSFRILVSKGADPNAQDSNGNTVLHVMVIREEAEMFDLAAQVGASLQITNRQGLTPIALAAFLPSPTMFHHILEFSRELYWEYGGVFCAAYPLPTVDTIVHTTGMLNADSVLAQLVYGDSPRHLLCLNFFVEELCQRKWDTFARRTLLGQVGRFLLYYAALFVAFYHRPTPGDTRAAAHDPFVFNVSDSHRPSPRQRCALDPSLGETPLRLVCEAGVAVGAVLYVLSAIRDYRHVGLTLTLRAMKGFPASAAFLLSCFLVLAMVPLRVFCWLEAENVVGVSAILLTATRFLFFFRSALYT